MSKEAADAHGGWEPPARRVRWRVRVTVAVAALVGLAGVSALAGLLLSDGRDEGQLTVRESTQEAPGPGGGRVELAESGPRQGEGWRHLPEAPLRSRFDALSAWTGDEWLVVGGRQGTEFLATGARYDPERDAWAAMADAPERLSAALQRAAWSGSKLFVWGRSAGGGQVGVAYDPGQDRWQRLPDAPLRPRTGHGLAWVGDELLVWGGSDEEGPVGNGAAYDPTAGTWRTLPEAPLSPGEPLVTPAGDHLLVWTQRGEPYGGAAMRGARYTPDEDRWRPLAPTDAPVGGPSAATAVWTGTSVIVCCDADPDVALDVYDPVDDEWSPRAAPDTVADRMLHTAVWTGEEMLLWGGRQDLAVWLRGNGARYEPNRRAWTAVPEAAPRIPRIAHAAAWTGEELLVWGGFDGRQARADGAAFRP